MTIVDYDRLVRSNWGFISPEHQQKIKDISVLLAGCGLGSTIAVLAARSGFTRFILADGDRVEVGNLNRQAFRLQHLDCNKAEATAELIREINPQAAIEVFPNFITRSDEVTALVSKAELIVNMVDPGAVLYQLNDTARSQNKTVFFPLNIAFGAAVLAFSPTSLTLREMLNQKKGESSEGFFLRLVEKLAPSLPGYVQQHMEIRDRVLAGNVAIPQLGVAACCSAAVTVSAMIKVVAGVPLQTAPYPMTMDTWEGANTLLVERSPDKGRQAL